MTNRRQILHSLLRYTTLAGIGLLSGGLLLKRSVSSAKSCTRGFSCGDCAALADCRLAPAIDTKQGLRR